MDASGYKANDMQNVQEDVYIEQNGHYKSDNTALIKQQIKAPCPFNRNKTAKVKDRLVYLIIMILDRTLY